MSESQKAQYDAAVEAARNERRRAREAASSKSDSHPTGTSPPPALNNTKVKALFVHLRKIANHPLLVRSRWGGEEIAEISDVCHRRGVFGHEATRAKVESHVKSLSDFDLHQLCGEQGHLSNLCLPPAAFSGAQAVGILVPLGFSGFTPGLGGESGAASCVATRSHGEIGLAGGAAGRGPELSQVTGQHE